VTRRVTILIRENCFFRGCTGAITGIVQIGRGIMATPQSIIAPCQGKWWNEYEGEWVLTSLPEEREEVLKGVPDDDKDILGTFEDEIDDSI